MTTTLGCSKGCIKYDSYSRVTQRMYKIWLQFSWMFQRMDKILLLLDGVPKDEYDMTTTLGCPKGWIRYDYYCYWIGHWELDWKETSRVCRVGTNKFYDTVITRKLWNKKTTLRLNLRFQIVLWTWDTSILKCKQTHFSK